MTQQWFYLVEQEKRGPVNLDAMLTLCQEGTVTAKTLVWKEGLTDWVPASDIPEIFPHSPSTPLADPGPLSKKSKRGLFNDVGAKISEAAELPTLSNVPVRDILMGGLQDRAGEEEIEEEFVVGTRNTTPKLAEISTKWPTPRAFWRILAIALATYFLLYIGITEFRNVNFLPGLIVIGAFVVPATVVVLFFELNIPRNVSIYQVAKLLMLGGAIGLIATSLLIELIPGSGAGNPLRALLTGVLEETGKALALLIVIRTQRYRWQLNGLLFGAAVGAGFAGFETAGYAMRYFFADGMDTALTVLNLRALLSPGGHVIWTAMVGSALWRLKGDQPFHAKMLIHRDVLRRWAVAVILHGLWDSNLYVHPYIKLAVLVAVGWYIIMAILKQAFGEVAEAQKHAAAKSGAAMI